MWLKGFFSQCEFLISGAMSGKKGSKSNTSTRRAKKRKFRGNSYTGEGLLHTAE